MSNINMDEHCYDLFPFEGQNILLLDCLWSEFNAPMSEKKSVKELKVNIYESSYENIYKESKRTIIKNFVFKKKQKAVDFVKLKSANIKLRVKAKAVGVIDYFSNHDNDPRKIKDEDLFKLYGNRLEAFNKILEADNDIDRI